MLMDGVVWALLIGAVFMTGCAKHGEESAPEGGVRTEAFDDWKAFLQSDSHKKAKRHPVVFIGLDAGVWQMIDREVAAGRMPNFARIEREGAYGTLRSTENYVTPPAWTSMFTGYRPEKTGIYTFGYWDRAQREFISGNSNDVLVPSVWDAASRAGLKVGVFNVPMTYPPHEVNGAMVTGQMTPIEVENAETVWPAPQKGPRLQRYFRPAPGVTNYSQPAPGMVEDSLNVFLALLHDTVDDGREAFDTVALTVMTKGPDGEPADVLAFKTFPVGKYSPWLPFNVRRAGRVVRAYTRLKITPVPNDFRIEIAPTVFPIDAVFTYPEDLAQKLNAEFGFYLPTKFTVKEVVPTLTEDMAQYASYFYDYDDWDLFCFVFTQTDNIQHVAGFSEPTSEVYDTIDRLVGDIMARMPSDATLIIGSDHGAGEYDRGIDLNMLLHNMGLLEWTDAPHIDYDRTVVFHNLWHLYFNDSLVTREELAKRGLDVPAGTDARTWLVDHLRRTSVRMPDGSTFVVEAEPLPDDAAGNAPDMIVRGSEGNTVIDFWNIMSPHPQVIRDLVGSERFWHIREGIYLMWGEGVRKGIHGEEQDIENIAPTILYLLGLPVDPDMDGHAMTDLFTPDAAAKRPLLVNRAYRDLPRVSADPDAERETLQKKLRSLGYVQ